MLKFFENLSQIVDKGKETKNKLDNADKHTKTDILKLLIIGLLVTLIIGVIQLIVVVGQDNRVELNTAPNEEQIFEYNEFEYEIEENSGHEVIPEDLSSETLKEEQFGIGQTIPNPIDALNPFSSFQESIVSAFAEIILQGIELFDDYVSFTPNIANSNGKIVDARGNQIPLQVDKFYSVTTNVAWLLLPLIIVVTGSTILLEGKIKGVQLLIQTGKKVLLFLVAMASMRFIFSILISLANALNVLVLQRLVGISGVDTLSESLLLSFGMNVVDGTLQFTLNDALNLFGEVILWIGLFIFLILLLFQFIIRFFHLLLHLILFPIVLVIGLLPSGGKFFSTYIEEVLRTLFVQPIFLIGIAVTIEIISSVDEPVPKIILGLGSLAFLNLIPSLVNRFSGILWGVGGAVAGGVLAGATIEQARMVKRGFVSGVTGGKGQSVRNIAGKVMGEGVRSAIPFGNTASKGISTPQKLMKGQEKAGAFKKALQNEGKGSEAFAKLGMSKLSGKSLKPESKTKELYTATPNFSSVSDISLRDSDKLSSSYINSNFDSFLGDYPMTEQPVTLNQMVDLSNFSPSHRQTPQIMESVIEPQAVQTNLGRTFDTDNKEHWNHVSQWYAKNESMTNGRPIENYQKFVQNPENKREIVRRASSEGYFKVQGINTVKMKEQVNGNDPVTKYYKVTNPKNFKSKTVKTNARNRTSKTK